MSAPESNAFLMMSDRKESTEIIICLYFDDEEFSNLSYQNINELYQFKKTLQDNKIIIPILKESKLSKKSVSFTPINPSDLISLDGLLPPKSTWITPRL